MLECASAAVAKALQTEIKAALEKLKLDLVDLSQLIECLTHTAVKLPRRVEDN